MVRPVRASGHSGHRPLLGRIIRPGNDHEEYQPAPHHAHPSPAGPTRSASASICDFEHLLRCPLQRAQENRPLLQQGEPRVRLCFSAVREHVHVHSPRGETAIRIAWAGEGRGGGAPGRRCDRWTESQRRFAGTLPALRAAPPGREGPDRSGLGRRGSSRIARDCERRRTSQVVFGRSFVRCARASAG
jgi:hypothetical protein